jgi:hypothetical protein
MKWSGNFPTFPRKNGNEMKIWKRKWNFVKWKWKRNFFGGSGNGSGTAFSGGTDAEIEFMFPTDAKFPFYSGFAWSIQQTQYMTLSNQTS